MTAVRRGFLTGGTWCVDRNMSMERWPDEESSTAVTELSIHGGGSGFNFAADIKRLNPDTHVETIGVVGNDDHGDLLLQLANDLSIDTRQLRQVAGHPTHWAIAFLAEKTQRRTHVYDAGVSSTLDVKHFDFTKTSARMLHLGLPGAHALLDKIDEDGQNGWSTLLRLAKEHGLETNLELMSIAPDRLRKLAGPCLDYLDYLVVNDFELGALAGIELPKEGSARRDALVQAITVLLDRTNIKIIVAHYPEGAVAGTRSGQIFYQPSVRVPAENIVSSNGAGDAFAAGFFYALHENWDIESALRLGHAVSARSLLSSSATEAISLWSDCLKHAERLGWRGDAADEK
ncbi:carbohydrate kinase family protein [Lentilitoribacter sp. EG35]|uniref:carbohydrate kinase family protein n=1 Tax=Lentilitoribacter sp. EG35 TaxID=3234192 RepID=UPI00345F4F41